MSESKWKRSPSSVVSAIPRPKTRSISSSSTESISKAISTIQQQGTKSKIPTFTRARSLPNIVKAVNHKKRSLSLNDRSLPNIVNVVNHQKRSLSVNDHIDVSDDLLTLSVPLHTDENNWLVTSECINENVSCKDNSENVLKSADENTKDTDIKALDCKYYFQIHIYMNVV